MATAIVNNLYPPVIASYMPSFIHTDDCKVYFSLSSYNSRSDIAYVQYTILHQNTNFNAIDPKAAVTGIYTESRIEYDEERKQYYITISPKILKGEEFQINQFYKLQLRFVKIGAITEKDYAEVVNQSSNAMAILNKYTNLYSEWSTICLLKGISKPNLYIKVFEHMDTGIDLISIPELIDIIGTLTFEDPAEKEYLESYEFSIKESNNDKILFNSSIQYTNEYNPNEFNYVLDYRLDDSTPYLLTFKYITNNGFVSEASYKFIIIESGIDKIEATVSAENEEDLGRVKIHIEPTTTNRFIGNLAIRRASNLTNYSIWEDVHIVHLANVSIDYTWYDYTAESGVWYKYCVQRINSFGDRGIIVETKEPIMLVYDDSYLVNESLQLKLKFDPQISSFKKTVMDTKIDTIGGKYPIISRNGNVGYRQFPISGLITVFCDEEGLFLNRENILGAEIRRYDDYNVKERITAHKDFIYEREFRERIMEFLYQHDAKLFKSTTEGNILVKLMDINFTPNATLGRMIYSFSATAYEIDDATTENYDKYNIQPIGTWSEIIQYKYEKIGQMIGTFGPLNGNIIDKLQEEYKNTVIGNFKLELKELNWLKLEFEGEPYLIGTAKDGSLYKETENIKIPEEDRPNAVLGYIVNINGKDIVVGKRGIYELLDTNTKITSLHFPAEDTKVIINYVANIKEVEDTSKLAKRLYYYTKIGQIINKFEMKDSIVRMLYMKYWEDYTQYYQQLLSINRITVEAMPGSVIYIKDSFDENYSKHIIGETGILDFYDDEATLIDFYFEGVQLYETLDTSRDEIEDNAFYETQVNIINFTDIQYPKKNYVYIKDNQRYIYYDSEWYLINDKNIVQCPVKALINYIYELVKGEYDTNENQVFLFNR